MPKEAFLSSFALFALLRAELEKCVQVLPRLPEQENTGTALRFDRVAIVQMMKAGGTQSFGKLAEKYYQYITSPFQQPGCNRVDVIFDRYDKPCSIKGNERERRGASSALELQNSGINTSVIHNIKAISLHSCHRLGAKSVNKNCTMDKCLSWEVVLKSATKPSWWSKAQCVLFSLYNQITKKQIQE